jgi:hypothetical protein
MENITDKALKKLQTEVNTQENGKTINNTDKALQNVQTELNT